MSKNIFLQNSIWVSKRLNLTLISNPLKSYKTYTYKISINSAFLLPLFYFFDFFKKPIVALFAIFEVERNGTKSQKMYLVNVSWNSVFYPSQFLCFFNFL
jgi:hypothetical protein